MSNNKYVEQQIVGSGRRSSRHELRKKTYSHYLNSKLTAVRQVDPCWGTFGQ